MLLGLGDTRVLRFEGLAAYYAIGARVMPGFDASHQKRMFTRHRRHAGRTNIAGLGEIGNETIDRLNPEMDIDVDGNAMVTQGGAHHRPDRQVRHIVIIHDVEVNDIRTCGQDVIHFFAQPRKVGRQNGWGQSCNPAWVVL